MRAIFQWNIGSRVLELGRRTLIMGVVNVTPDSFSDGGLYLDAEKAVVRAEQLLDEGATIIDVGGKSTRPGASEPVSEEEERRRVLPVIRDLKRRRPDAVISVDTYKAGVSRKSCIGRTLARDGKDAGVAERLYGTLAAETGLILKGAHIIRTHDVRFAVDAARVADAIVASGG